MNILIALINIVEFLSHKLQSIFKFIVQVSVKKMKNYN